MPTWVARTKCSSNWPVPATTPCGKRTISRCSPPRWNGWKVAPSTDSHKQCSSWAIETNHEDAMANPFFWYDVMTTDTAAGLAFYKDVVGWGSEDTAPGMDYTLLTVDSMG